MTLDDKWFEKYEEIMDFMEINRRNPSKHRPQEMHMVNWLKHCRKLINAGKMPEDRVKMFEMLRMLADQYKRVNQYQ